MTKKPGFLSNLIDAFKPEIVHPIMMPNRILPTPTVIDDRPKTTALPAGRSSRPSNPGSSNVTGAESFRVVTHQFVKEYIEVIRMLSIYNENVGQAIHNIVSLGNTGHKIFFDKKVSPDQVDAMRNHLTNKRKNWAPGQAGMDGLINKWFSQLMITGALSGEWIVNKDLTGIQSYALVNPEEVIFILGDNDIDYEPWQIPRGGLVSGLLKKFPLGRIKLNTLTYKYLALNGDTEVPYGIPPYIPVVKRVETQANMDKNINFVVDQLGLIGFLEALIGKPDQVDEADEAYTARLDNLLTTAKDRLAGGFKEGIVVGFKEDCEFDFKSAAKEFKGVAELYNNNEIMFGSGLKQDMSLLGRNYNTSETNITVVFMKMLSELRNLQNIVGTALEYGYALELRLAGFTFDYLTVKFNRSTIQDDLKSQQAEEIKVRNIQSKMLLGLIDQNTAADELGYEVPAFPKPMVSWDILAGGGQPKPVDGAGTPAKGAGKKADTKKKKTANDKKNRAKNK